MALTLTSQSCSSTPFGPLPRTKRAASSTWSGNVAATNSWARSGRDTGRRGIEDCRAGRVKSFRRQAPGPAADTAAGPAAVPVERGLLGPEQLGGAGGERNRE